MSSSQIVKDLLSRGATQAQAAQGAQVSLSYVSQLLSNTDFAQEVERNRLVHLQKHTVREERCGAIYDSYLDLEESLLHSLKTQSMMMRPNDKVRLLQVIGSKKPPAPAAIQQDAGPRTLINITLPQIMAENFTVNSKQEIVALGGQDFAPLPTAQLKELAKNAAAANKGAHNINSIFDLEPEDLELKRA